MVQSGMRLVYEIDLILHPLTNREIGTYTQISKTGPIRHESRRPKLPIPRVTSVLLVPLGVTFNVNLQDIPLILSGGCFSVPSTPKAAPESTSIASEVVAVERL